MNLYGIMKETHRDAGGLISLMSKPGRVLLGTQCRRRDEFQRQKTPFDQGWFPLVCRIVKQPSRAPKNEPLAVSFLLEVGV